MSPATTKRSSILGISAYYHDSAAALLCDGDLVAAAQQERFAQEARCPLSGGCYPLLP